MAQLAEMLLPISEIRGSNPVFCLLTGSIKSVCVLHSFRLNILIGFSKCKFREMNQSWFDEIRRWPVADVIMNFLEEIWKI